MYKNLLVLVLITLSICACSKKEHTGFSVTGSVKGLKKGTLYLQKIEDTLLVNLDSLVVDGNPDFEFTANLKEPEVLFLYLDKVDNSQYDDRIFFFAEPTAQMSITTTLENFESFATITGSENHTKWAEFQKINTQFNNQNLDLIKGSFDAQKNADEALVLVYDDSIKKLIQRKYRYTGQFVINNKSLEIAPYIILSQISDAKLDFLDDLYMELPKNIQESKYGIALNTMLDERRIDE